MASSDKGSERDAFLLVLLLEGFWERAALLEAPCPAQLLIHFLPVGFLQCLNGFGGDNEKRGIRLC